MIEIYDLYIMCIKKEKRGIGIKRREHWCHKYIKVQSEMGTMEGEVQDQDK